MYTLGEALQFAIATLSRREGESPRLDAELLLCEASGTNRAALIAWPERTLQSAQEIRFRRLVARRANGEPIAYILGHREFWGLDLQVTPQTLIPRPATELVVECTLSALPTSKSIRCADLGAGSGAIAAALARERPTWTLIAIERCAGAAAVAASNVRQLGLNQMLVVRADWLCAIARRSLDAIVSNPPYVRDDDAHLEQGDLRFEPRTSLAAGRDGLDDIREIIANASDCLRPGGWLAIEHGWDQGEPVRQLMSQARFDAVATHLDLAGHERVSTGIAPVNHAQVSDS
ncbi:MAG: peptide chain release factor N(5)-glutamine methyltransferase [Thiohalocapsa sp.]